MPKQYLDKPGLAHFWGKLKTIIGVPEAPYQEVEWVESNGKQFVYLDWKPPIATWGFEADFLIRNAFVTTVGAWNATTNANGYGALFGTSNAETVNDITVSTYSSTGYVKIGGSTLSGHGLKKDKTRQTMSLIGTLLTKPDGTTMNVNRVSETAGKPFANLVVFGKHVGVRRTTYGNILAPSTTRLYSLKFYEGTTLAVDLVGAIRKADGATGLYDKVSQHFYPAHGMIYGDVVGDLGEPCTLLEAIEKAVPNIVVNNIADTRMWEADAPTLEKLEDGQKICVTYLYNVGASVQADKLPGWEDSGSSSVVYLKLHLADGGVTDWIPCYYAPATRLTTHYGPATSILLTYRENVAAAASATATGNTIMRGFYADPNYDTDTKTIYQVYLSYVYKPTGTYGVKNRSIMMEDGNGCFQSLSKESGTGTAKTKNPSGFRFPEMFYIAKTSDTAADTVIGSGSNQYVICWIDFRYSSNCGSTLDRSKDVYLVGRVGSDGLFYLDDDWYTQDLPTQEDGKAYIYVGSAGSTYQVSLAPDHPVYIYKDGALRLYSGYANYADNVPTKTSELTNDSNFVASSGSLTGGSVLVADSSGRVSSSGTTATELSRLNGVTSSIQTQLNAKANASSLAAVATSGSYNDLADKPTIPGAITLLDVYPVGSIYMSINNTDPGTLFGGTWEQLKDRFLLAAGDTYSGGDTGGSEEVTLTANQSGLPAHKHGFSTTGYSFVVPDGTQVTRGSNATGSVQNVLHSTKAVSLASIANNAAANAAEAHENMPPYLAVYMWKRTA